MKLYTIVYLIILTLIFVVDFGLFRQDPNRSKTKKILFLVPTVLYVLLFTFIKFFGATIVDFRFNMIVMWFNFSFLLVYIPRTLFILFNFLEKKASQHADALRRVRNLFVGSFYIILFVSAFYTSRRIQKVEVSVKIDNLATAFENFKILQLSDLHLGARPYDKAFYADLVQQVNAQNADLIVFTGDMVNNFADEMKGFEPVFSAMHAKYGKFAVLGNHDSGDYSEWESEAAKAKNLQNIKAGFREFGFQLLDNSNVMLRKSGDSIALVGVGHFHKKEVKSLADLTKATQGLAEHEAKILLCHNPDYWEHKVWEDASVALTLSGHTHAGQLGVDFFGKIYSPVALLYSNYNGLYTHENQHLYVSHGLGYIGLPFMLGIRPEFNVITLKK